MISIVIPIYKSEKYLKQAITSILKQSFSDFELILVNDGSPDDSEIICLEYAHADQRIKYIKQENQGAAHAMFTGLNAALGEYVLFLDGDDWIHFDTLLKTHRIAKKYNADIVFWNHVREFETESTEGRKFLADSKFFEGHDLNWLQRRVFGLVGDELKDLRNFDLISSGWGKLFRKEILLSDPYILIGINGKGNFDTELTCRAFSLSKSIYFLNEPLNHYRMGNIHSVSKNHGNELYFKHKEMFISLLAYIQSKNLGSEYIQAIHNRITVSILNNLLSITSKNNKHSLRTKYKALNRILTDDLYIESVSSFQFKALHPFYRYFFYICKFRWTSAVFFAGFFLRLFK